MSRKVLVDIDSDNTMCIRFPGRTWERAHDVIAELKENPPEGYRMVESIVRAGVPDITYGIIVGMPNDSQDSLKALFDALLGLRERVKAINPAMRFRVVPYAIRPLPGTPSTKSNWRS